MGLVPSSHTGLEQGQGQQEKDKGKSKGKSKGKGKDVDSRGQLLPGDRVVGVVLDVVPHQGLVELSLKEELKRAAKDGKGLGLALKRLEVGTGWPRPGLPVSRTPTPLLRYRHNT